MLNTLDKNKVRKLLSLLAVSLITLGVGVTGYSFTFKEDTDKTLEALNTLKTHYIQAVEVDAQITLLIENEKELLLSLIEDNSKFWVVDKNDFMDKKEDFERLTILVDSTKDNVLRGEQYCLDGEFYNLIDKGINTDELTELDYKTYKELELTYIENIEDVTFYTSMRMNGLLSIGVGVFLYLIKLFIKR